MSMGLSSESSDDRSQSASERNGSRTGVTGALATVRPFVIGVDCMTDVNTLSLARKKRRYCWDDIELPLRDQLQVQETSGLYESIHRKDRFGVRRHLEALRECGVDLRLGCDLESEVTDA